MMTGEQKMRALERIGSLIKREAIRRCPTDNGQLRNSINFRIDGDSVIIYADAEYAIFAEYGTGIYHEDLEGNSDPHEGWDVHPVNAQSLAFEVDRKERLVAGGNNPNIIFAKKVHIEGMRAHPFMRPAIHQNIDVIKKIIEEEAMR